MAPPQHEAGGGGRSGHDVFGSDKVSLAFEQPTRDTGDSIFTRDYLCLQFDPLGGGLLGDEPQVSSARLRSLILSKEKELHDINQFRIDTLEQVS